MNFADTNKNQETKSQETGAPGIRRAYYKHQKIA